MFSGVAFERDNKITNLKNEVFSQLSDIMKIHDPTPPQSPKVNNVNSVSVEDAINELIAMGVEV